MLKFLINNIFTCELKLIVSLNSIKYNHNYINGSNLTIVFNNFFIISDKRSMVVREEIF